MEDRSTATLGLSTERQIETQLHTQLEASRIKYESVLDAYKSALKSCDDLRPAHGYGNGNGNSQRKVRQPIAEAAKAQHDAFEEYRLALHTFNKFILYGELPK